MMIWSAPSSTMPARLVDTVGLDNRIAPLPLNLTVLVALVLLISGMVTCSLYVPGDTLNTTGPVIPQLMAVTAAAKVWKFVLLAGSVALMVYVPAAKAGVTITCTGVE